MDIQMKTKPWSRSVWVLVTAITTLFLLSLWLGQIRIFQVDEIQWVFESRILGTHAWNQAATSAPLWLLGPLSWWAKHCSTSAAIFQGDRLVFTFVFWVNLLLLVKAAGFRLRSKAGGLALLAAATLEPLWDYGFEIRHDNLILTGVLALWLLLVPRGKAIRPAYALSGLLAALMQFCAFKAFMYWIPISALVLFWPHPAHERRRLTLAAEWGSGFLGGVLIGLAIHLLSGTRGLYLMTLLPSFQVSVQAERFSPWMAFGRLFTQTPLLLGGVVAFGVWAMQCWRTGSFRRDSWESGAPEMALLLIGSLVLLANPTPFPYNLVLWVPFAFLAAMRMRVPLAKALEHIPNVKSWLLAGLLAAHLAPWFVLTPRHWDHTNDRQMQVVDAAESLTSASDAVFDGAGLVPTRAPFGFHWLLHTLTMPHFLDGSYPPIRQSLADRCVPVILPSYRTDWLPGADKAFIVSHYVPLAPDLWVLGAQTAPSGGVWTCLHAGRYFITSSQEGGANEIFLDGRIVQKGPLEMDAGVHAFKAPHGARVWVGWLGPTLKAPPQLGESQNGPLFQNWY